MRDAHTMLGHLGVNVPDLVAAQSYYGELLPLLGFELFFAKDDEFAFMPGSGKRGTFIFFYPSAEEGEYSRHRTGLQHLAFMVPTRATVTAAVEAAARLGSEVVHEPQDWPQYPPPYFAGFWTDPFGFLLEAVCHHDR